MKRREFITLLGGAAAAWPLAARAQLDRARRIGVLSLTAENDARVQGWLAAMRERLPELGWADGSIRIDYRWGDGNIDRLGVVAKELVESRPDVIFAGSTPSVTAIARATRTIPIVFANVSDPIGTGLVESLARPGGNLTGFTNYEYTVGGKWVEILKELEPRLRRIAVVFNPATAPNQGSQYLRSIESAARSLAIEPISTPINDIGELELRASFICSRLQCRPNRDVGRLCSHPSETPHIARSRLSPTGGLSISHHGRRRRLGGLWFRFG